MIKEKEGKKELNKESRIEESISSHLQIFIL